MLSFISLCLCCYYQFGLLNSFTSFTPFSKHPLLGQLPVCSLWVCFNFVSPFILFFEFTLYLTFSVWLTLTHTHFNFNITGINGWASLTLSDEKMKLNLLLPIGKSSAVGARGPQPERAGLSQVLGKCVAQVMVGLQECKASGICTGGLVGVDCCGLTPKHVFLSASQLLISCLCKARDCHWLIGLEK